MHTDHEQHLASRWTELWRTEFWYRAYLAVADDGDGNDATTGQPLKTFDEWMAS